MTTSSQRQFLSIDIGKDVFHLVGFDPSGKIVMRKMNRPGLLASEGVVEIPQVAAV